MIEAVNSVISNAPLLRGNGDQVRADRSSSAVDVDIAQAPQAPLLDIEVNYDYNKAVLRVLDGNTGDVLSQFPSNEQLEARLEAEARATTSASETSRDDGLALAEAVSESLSASGQSLSSRSSSQGTAEQGASDSAARATSLTQATNAVRNVSASLAQGLSAAQSRPASGTTVNVSA